MAIVSDQLPRDQRVVWGGNRAGRPRVALIGVSGYGRAYLEWVEAAMVRGLLRLVAVVVVNREEEEAVCARLEARGAVIYDCWTAMFEAWRGRIDLCLAPVPIHLHAPVAVAALEAGANVLLEKPLAATVEQARAIQDAERRTGRWVAVGYQDYYAAANRAIADELAAGRIGRIKAIRWLGLWPRPESYYRRNSWAGRLALGGCPVRDSPLNNAMAHYLNLSLYWAWAGTGRMPEPSGVEAELFRAHPIESFDTAVMRLKTSAGVTILSAVSHCCEAERPILLRVLGDAGELQWSHRCEAVWISGGTETGRMAMGGRTETMDAMFEAVLARLSNPGAAICSSEQAVLQVRAIEALPSRICPIEEPRAWKVTKNGENWMVVGNIEEDLTACLESDALPSEVGAVWATPGTLAAA